MDLSRLSDDDLSAISNGDMSKVSNKGLDLILRQQQYDKELQNTKPDTGFTGAFGAGKERFKGDVAAVLGRTGIMNTDAAEEYKAQKERLADKMLKPTEESWAEAPWMKFKETLGGSLPYTAAPLAVGLGAAALPAIGVATPIATGIGMAGAGLASLGQFTGSNLSRQMQENPNLRLKDTDLMAAGAAAVPQAALDVVSLRMIPGIGKIFGAAGKEVTPELAKRIAEQGILKTAGYYGVEGVKLAGKEGATEAGQQFFERLQAGLNIADEQARSEYFDNFIGGAVLGGALSVPGVAIERRNIVKEGAQMEEEQKRQAIIDRQKAQREAYLAQQAQLKQTSQNLGVPQNLALPAPEAKLEAMPEAVDPLINPLGRFKSTDLSAKEVAEVNKRRKEMGKPRIGHTFSIEDLADVFTIPKNLDPANPEDQKTIQQIQQNKDGVLNRLIASRTGFQAGQDMPPQTIELAAQQRGIDTRSQGFKDFLTRVAGEEDLTTMSPPQRVAVQQALQNVKVGEESRILEAGISNAKHYTADQYNDTIAGLFKEFKQMGNQENGRSSVLKLIEKYSGLKNERDQQRILDEAVKNGDFERNLKVSSTGHNIETFKPAEEIAALPGGMDIRKETFKQGETPETYEIRAGNTVLSSRDTQEEADRDLAAYELSRQTEIIALQKQIQGIQNGIAARNADLTRMQALGQDQTDEFFKKSADYYGADQQANEGINALRQKQQQFTAPVQVVPVGTKPIAKESYTFYEKDEPQVKFDTEEQAEQYGISRLDDATLEQIIRSAPSQKQTGRVKRYVDLAQKELDERQSIEEERGIAVTTTKGLKGSKERLEKLGIYSKEVHDNLEKLRQTLLPALKRYGLEKVALRILNSIEDGKADGYYIQQVMAIALDAKDAMGTLRHESIHALKELGAFTPQEWKILENKAKSEWIQKYIKDAKLYDSYKEQYIADHGNLIGFESYIQEEAIAEAFKHFKVGNLPAGMIGNIWSRLNKMFEALGNAFNKLGFQTSEDIFTKIEKGEKQPTTEAVGKAEKKMSFNPEETEIANKTSRSAGAVSAQAIVPRYVEQNAKKGERILDFGAGKDAVHTARLRGQGLNVTAHEFGTNQREGIHDLNALNKKYDHVYASNVLNVQSSKDMLGKTLDQMTSVLEKNGKLTANFPSSPRKSEDITPQVIKDELQKRFENVERVGGTGSAPLFHATKPKLKYSLKQSEQFPKNAVNTNNWKATPVAKEMAEEYAKENDFTPYLSEGQLSIPVEPVKYSIKPPSDDRSKNDPLTGLPLNKNGSVTLYYPTTAEEARRINNEKKLIALNPNMSSIYLTNESSGWKSLGRMGDAYQQTDGSVVRVEIDPNLLQMSEEYPDGRKEFYVPVKEGEYFNKKMRLWAMYAERSKPIPLATKYSELGNAFARSLDAFKQLNEAQKRVRTKEVKDILKKQHNIGKLLGENGKLEKTRVGDYGITYDDKSVASLGLGLASAQKLNDKTSTCPVSAICEGLCLGDTSGNNMMYGGMASGELAKSLEKTSFRAGPRLSQYLKTEAMMVHPEEFVLLLDKEIKAFKRWADKNEYLPAIRLNVTSDIPPKYLKPIMDANPDVMFYDYTKLDSSPVAKNHHLTYSSTGVSQVVNGEKIVNKEQNWDRMKRQLDGGSNVAMAFTSKNDMPSVVIDEASGKEYQVWNGDNYDARFLDPKRNDGVGMIIGLTNKAATLKAPTAAKETNGFFIDYDKSRDGDRAVIQDQSKFAGNKVIPITPAKRFSLREPNAWYYSQLERGIQTTPDRIFGKAPQVKEWLVSNAAKLGVKSEELQFSGINDWLDLQGDKKVSKDDVLNYLQQGGVRLEDVKKSEQKDETKYEQWQLDGGTNYQEMLLTLPGKQIPSNWEVVYSPDDKGYKLYSSAIDGYAKTGSGIYDMTWYDAKEAKKAIKDYAPTQDSNPDSPKYKSSHWREENILAHIRMNDRKDRDGAKVLFIEEIQSDWHQAGRKRGYEEPLPQNLSPSDLLWEYGPKLSPRQKNDLRDFIERYELSGITQIIDEGLIPKEKQQEVMDYARAYLDKEYKNWLKGAKAETGIPNAPFKDTKAWTGLALKRIIAYAVENKYDKVAFINGEQSADRYNIRDKIDNILYRKNDNGTYDVDALKEKRTIYAKDDISLNEIEETFGKDIAKKMEEGVDSSLTKEQAKKKIDEAISKWKEKALSGDLGVYDDGEIEKIESLMSEDPGAYTATLNDFGATYQIIDKYQGRGYNKKKELSGVDISVGGEGMINYYDKILPQVAKDVLRKIGGGDLEKVIVPVRVMVPSNVEFKYTVVSDLTNDNAYVQDAKTGERVTTEPMSYDDAKDWLRAHDPATSNAQTGFSITEKIRGKVSEGLPLFSLRSQLSDSLNERIGATTTKRQEKGYVDRIIDAISPTAMTRIRQGLINKYESIEQLSRLRGEKMGGDQLLAENSAIAAALQSDRAAGIAASSFRDGVPVLDKGYTYVTDMDGKVKGLIPILEPLMKYKDPYIFQTFQYYAGTRRGRRLDAEGREKTFTKEDIAYGKELEAQFPEFADVFNEYQKYNQGLVKYMMDTGVISPQEAKIWTENWDYIPFYRQLEGEKTAGPKVFSPIAGVAKPKKLKGSEAPLDDFMETIVRNARAAIEAGMKNEAARRVIRDVTDFGLGERLPSSQSGSDVVSVKENGMTVYYRVADPLLVESLKGLNLPQLPFMDFLSAPANLLRNFVTKDPGFILANLGRDSMQAWITSGTDMKPLVDTFKQFGKELMNQSPEAYALAKAGLTGYDFAGDVKSTAKQVEKELRKRGGARTAREQALLPITSFWEMLEKGSHASDMATRAEVYKRTLERTGSEAEAFYQAMEVLNFSRKGNSAFVRILSAMIPFFNARVQGLDVLYRTGFGKAAMENKETIQKAFIFRSMVLLGTSVMYWGLMQDDEDYKKLSKEEKDNYWIIPAIQVGDKPFRFPIPFELGVLFKVLPERALEYSFGTDTGKDLREALFRNAMSTLSFNPIPQAVLPLVENSTNHSFFTGEPIIGKGVEGLAPQFQFGSGTSELAKKLGRELEYSPQKIDNLIRGYTGTMGSYAMMMLDSALTGEGDPVKATKRMEQLPVIKRFFAGDMGNISAYYELKQEVDTVVQTVNTLQRTGNSEDLKEYLDENKKLYGLKSYVSVLDKNMKQLNQMAKLINASKTMTADEKREALDKIHDGQLKLTERVRILRKQQE